jgi:group I intron endonuclease
MKTSGIYKIQSISKSERYYIGSAINIEQRWRLHLHHLRKNCHGSIFLQRHFNKYGIDDLQFSILYICDKKYLVETEQYCLDLYNPLFNLCKKAYSPLGIKHFKMKHSNVKGKNNPMFGKHHSEESKKLQSEAASLRMGEKNPFYNKHHSKESKLKIGKASKERHLKVI